MREQAIQNLIVQGLSESLAQTCVDLAGNIDHAKVDTIKAGMAWGRNPVSQADPGLIRHFKTP